jgi:hypothetical protein
MNSLFPREGTLRVKRFASLGHLALFAAIAIATACSNSPERIVGERIADAPRPGASESAVLTTDSAGATTAFVRRLYLSNDHGKTGKLVVLAEADLHVRWRDAGTLEVTYPCGRIFSFSNFVSWMTPQGASEIKIVLANEGPLRCR